MKTLNINFYNPSINEAQTQEFMTAVYHEKSLMTIQLLTDDIAKLNKKISNEDNYSQEEIQAFQAQKQELEALRTTQEKSLATTLPVYESVVTAMTVKNENGFGNHKDVVRTVLRVLATWDNSKLVKYAIIPAFKSPALYEALETIHVTSRANEDGRLVMSKEVKQAYKDATKELESIIKNTFSLPFETIYTAKTRVKMDAEDKKLLNECYVKGFRNKFDVAEDGTVSFKSRQVNTLVKTKRNKKTGEVTCDYSGLATTLCNIVMKHYFA